jgi:hypothetical protein
LLAFRKFGLFVNPRIVLILKPEIVRAFFRAEVERANGSIEGRNSSLGDLAQDLLEIIVRHLGQIEIKRVLGEVTNRTPALSMPSRMQGPSEFGGYSS